MGTEILGCPVEAFLADYSPFLPNNTLIDAAIQALVHQQLLVTDKHCKTLFWKDFKNVPSSAVTESNVFKTFRDLAGIFNDEFGQLNGRRRYFFYRDCPDEDMKSENTGPNFRTYACFTANPSQTSNKHMLCAETAVVAEFKSTMACEDDMPQTPPTRSCSSLQNHEKLASAANHVMNDDPCRMWMYGAPQITIENTKMSVWYFSPSHCVKSETFDFTKDIRTVIRVLLSFTYATREQMGYDPTIHRIKDNEPQYVYEIPTEDGTRYFRTIHLLARHKSLCITGKKTRVWKVVEVKGFEGNAINEEVNGKDVALKDVWLDEGSTTEKEKLDAILERLKTIKEEAYAWAPSWLRGLVGKLGGKLSDLEYAKHHTCENANSNPKTGTAFFMPLEIHMGMAFERPPTSFPDLLTDVEITPDGPLLIDDQNVFCQTDVMEVPPQRAKYRFQHDLESLWWVALYVLIYRVDYPPGKELSKKVFTRSRVPTGARQELFVVRKVVHWTLARYLHPALKHESIVRSMNAIPAVLFKSYFMDEPVDPKALGELYHDVFRYLALIVSTIKNNVQDFTFHSNLTIKSKKRVHSKTSPKDRDSDEYEGHEPRSNDAVSNKKKKTSTSTAIRP
ncbi:hypothetical protein AGABI1DRAFT_95165 [Agaricus bisporus var. burnettii JB137-S8]|uniref:Fungal-type protein kinase domain-containing protein n=1 Tax=Agaricus bisporus var. burnettii (strain JB137-S8 / ATCC MYA-4627 / FGSC 10392) TaxID=597362 RepID=K5WIF3_AGABU|nr:uncharacterized protein AGABI1DRAFT_95165 [Agaricus bisporus var. burnettii JB137-S8]EKM75056.1 hypothetical protein AGABI1DRAFT_95165 [Agaricus bisporus var. burnettii JB137-S8]